MMPPMIKTPAILTQQNADAIASNSKLVQSSSMLVDLSSNFLIGIYHIQKVIKAITLATQNMTSISRMQSKHLQHFLLSHFILQHINIKAIMQNMNTAPAEKKDRLQFDIVSNLDQYAVLTCT